ncbi:MAG TPA: ABC transporter ATP-binding protein [Burkholderiaceae bacterium]|nr:ABC transporter ATP-binding protein [Burkholderiaceae bacterium]
MTTTTAVLEAQGVGKRFGAVVAAAEIHVRVDAGERVSLIGSNGAGKTTFVNMITGYLKPDVGHIRFDGRDITALQPRAIVQLGVARSFQIPQLFGELSVLDNMLVSGACHDAHLSYWQAARRGSAVERAEALLQRFALAEHRDRRVAELPGGVRKLLDIAMALTVRPKLLLLDEPTSGVSAEEKFPMMDTVMAALGSERDTTVLFVEHDMDIVARYADRVIAFAGGRIIADDVPDRALATDDVRRYVTGELLQE